MSSSKLNQILSTEEGILKLMIHKFFFLIFIERAKLTDSFWSLKPVHNCNPRAILQFWIFFLNICIYHVEYLRSWDLCLYFWISQSANVVSSEEYLRSWNLFLMCWTSKVLESVTAILNISGLKICVFCVNYLSPQDLCHPEWKSQILSAVSTTKENSES